jgi:GNAT superfamily N-acetyltransferase
LYVLLVFSPFSPIFFIFMFSPSFLFGLANVVVIIIIILDLDVLCTDSEHQRRGAGAMVVQYGCDIADREGFPIYIDASAKGKPLYEKFGFRDLSDPMFTSKGLASMVREPRKPAASSA